MTEKHLSSGAPRFVYLLIILALNFIVYFPSFFHAARADQLVYLTEVAEYRSFPELVGNTYSYTRQRQFNKGDEFGFRPLLFFFIALEKQLFGFNFTLWQATGLMLHGLLICQLVRFMGLLEIGLLGYLFVGLFSVLTMSMEMVIWHHISGYMLCLILFLEAFYRLVVFIGQGFRKQRDLGLAIGTLTLANFTYEYSVVGSGVLWLAVILAAGRKLRQENHSLSAPEIIYLKRIKWQLLIPLVLYFSINAADYIGKVGFSAKQLAFSGSVFQTGVGYQLGLAGATFVASILFPFLLSVEYWERTIIYPINEEWWQQVAYPNWGQAANILVVLVSLGIIVYWFVKVRRKQLRTRPSMLTSDLGIRSQVNFIGVVSAILGFGYFLFLLVVRLNKHGLLDYVYYSLYHFYIIALFLLIALGAWIKRVEFLNLQPPVWLKGTICILVAGLIFFNGLRTWQINQQRRENEVGFSRLVGTLNDFVQAHRSEEGFSFNIVWAEDDVPTGMYLGYPNDRDNFVGGFGTGFIFRAFNERERSKYFVVYTRRQGLVSFSSPGAAEEYLRRL